MRPTASTEQTLLNGAKVYINDEKQESTFLNNTRIELPDSKLKDGDIITVSQVGSKAIPSSGLQENIFTWMEKSWNIQMK